MARTHIPMDLDRRVREAAKNRCGYCLSPQHLVMARLEIEHLFRWSEDGLRIVGRTATGRATVIALHLSDDPDVLVVRSHWALAGWHPPTD